MRQYFKMFLTLRKIKKKKTDDISTVSLKAKCKGVVILVL